MTGKQPSGQGTGQSRSYSVSTTVHMMDAEIGYEWLLWHDHVYLRAALGFAGTVGAQAKVRPKFTPRPVTAAAYQEFESETESFLEYEFKHYVFTPVVSVGAGWRFF